MGIIKFRRSKKLFPGVRLNIGKKGPTSLSVGGKGATLNISTKGSKATAGIPGTGLSYSTEHGGEKRKKAPRTTRSSAGGIIISLIIIFAIFVIIIK